MNTIEPLLFNWDGKGIETDGNYQRRFREHSWSITSDFILHQAASNLCDEISRYTLQEKYAELVDSEIETVKDVLPVPENQIAVGEVSPRRGRQRTFYVRGESVITPSRRADGMIKIVSNNKNAARDLKQKLIGELNEIADQFHGAGIEEIDIYTSEEFTLENIDHPEAEISVSVEEQDEFEEQVMEEFTPLSEAFVGNVRISFENYSPDPEFDILFAAGPYGLLQIEVKDYSGTDGEPGKKEAIHKPLRRASLLNIDQTVSVIKGVSDETMEELRMSSELRNQIQVTKKEELVENIKPILERAAGQRPGFYPVK